MLARVEDEEHHTDLEVHRAIDLALRIGEVVLSSGAGAADVAATTLAVTNACGLRGCTIDVNFTTITVSYQPDTNSWAETMMRTVTYRGLDYGVLTDVDHLVRAMSTGRITRVAASHRLNEIRSAPRPYPRWVVSVATGLMAVGVGMLLQGNLLLVAVAFVTAVVIDLSNRQLSRRRIPAFYQQVSGALIATGVALGLYHLELPVSPSLLVAAGIIVLLAGVTLVGAVQDALTGYFVTASARTFEALLLTGGIIAGVSLGLTVGLRLGIDLPLQARAPTELSDLPLALTGGTLVAVSFAVACYAPWRALVPVAVIGLAGQAVYVPMLTADLGVAWASTMAAIVIGGASYSLAGRVRVPPLVVVVSGIVGLLPGLTIYRGLFQLLTQDDLTGLFSLLAAVSVGVGLASGVILGEYIAQPLKREARRLENRLAGPRLVGPLQPHRRRRRPQRPSADADADE